MAVSLSFILTSTGLVFVVQPGPILLAQLPIPPPEPEKLVSITSEEFYSLDPTVGSWIVSSLYDTLVSYDRDRTDRFRPLLVTEVPSLENGRISPDGLTYRFTIRRNSPLTSEDVEYSIKRAMIRGVEGMLQEALLGIESIADATLNNTGIHFTPVIDFEEIDNAVETEGNDVVFHLEKIYPPFLHALASSSNSILSKAWCIAHGDWSGTEENWEDYIGQHQPSPLDYTTQGFGPFMLERLVIADFNLGPYSYTKQITEIVLVRNEDYWRGPARLKRVEIKCIGDWETRKEMFLDGDADVCSVPEENYTQLAEIERIRIYTGLPTLEYKGLYFNFATANDSPYIGSGELDGNGVPPDFFSDIHIRKAFAYSIDYDTIINEIYGGEAQQPASPVIEGLSFHNPDQESYTYDPDMARQHFQQAWGGEVWDKGFNVTLLYAGIGSLGQVCIPPDRFAIGELINSSFKAINANFHVTLEPIWSVDWNQVSFIIGNHHPGLGMEDSFRDRLIGGFIYGTIIDSLIEAGMNTVDPEERHTIYYELQRLYHEVVPGVPLAQPTTRHYQRDWVWGWYYNLAAAGMDFYEMLKGTCQDATRNIIAHVDNLVYSVYSGVMPYNAGSSLTETLDSVIACMDNGNLTEASQVLNDFIDQVNALQIPVWAKGELTALAQEIIEVLTSSPNPTGGGFEMTMTPLAGVGVASIVVIVLVAWKERKIE